MILNQFQVRAALLTAGVPIEAIVEFSDGNYVPCTSEWLTGDYHLWFLGKALPAFGIREYRKEVFDCEDFADLFCSFARIEHRRASPDLNAGLPIGRFNFLLNPAGPNFDKHAIVWALTSDKGLIFIEPQVLYKVEKLTKAQIESCTRCSD